MKNSGEVGGENEGEWTGAVEISSRKKSLSAGDLLQALKGEPFSSGFSPDGSLITASHCKGWDGMGMS